MKLHFGRHSPITIMLSDIEADHWGLKLFVYSPSARQCGERQVYRFLKQLDDDLFLVRKFEGGADGEDSEVRNDLVYPVLVRYEPGCNIQNADIYYRFK